MVKIFLLFVCLAMSNAVLAASKQDVVKMKAEWAMSLDANGAITSLAAKPGQIRSVLRKVLETAIRRWEFEPGSISGKPAVTETNLIVSISLLPTPDGNSYAVKVDDVQTGAGLARIGKIPSMSRREIEKAKQDGVSLLVLLELTFDENGKPGEIILSDRSPVRNGPLVTEAITSVRSWSFKPERVAGHGVLGRVLLPICYVASANECTYPASKSDTPSGSGSSVALESSVTLKSDVIGKAL